MAIDERRTLSDEDITTTSVRTAARPGAGRVSAAMKDSDGTDTGDADGTDRADADGTDRADRGDQSDKTDSGDRTDQADRG